MQVVSKVLSCEGFATMFPKLLSIFSWFLLGFILGNYYANKRCKKRKQLNKTK